MSFGKIYGRSVMKIVKKEKYFLINRWKIEYLFIDNRRFDKSMVFIMPTNIETSAFVSMSKKEKTNGCIYKYV